MFSFLALHGRICDLGTVHATLERRNAYHGMLQLQHAAADLGVKCAARRLSVDQLRDALPAIVATEDVRTGSHSFNVVVAVTETQVVYINGPYATLREEGIGDYSRNFSGHAIVASRSPSSQKFLFLAIYVMLFITGFVAPRVIFALPKLRLFRRQE